MRRVFPFLCLLFVGCSNAPVAGFLDTCFPSKAKPDAPPGPSGPVAPPVGPTPTPVPPGPDRTPIPPPDIAPRVGP